MKKIIFLTLLVPQVLFAQVKQKNSYIVYVNYPDYSVKTTIFSKDKKISAKKSLTYYWYSSNRIIETTGGYDGKILNGTYTSFYLNGNLKEKGIFKNGVKNGEWIAWYENGKIREINSWNKGVKANSSKIFNTEGELISEAKYKSGKLHGYQTTYTNGKACAKKKYKNGEEVIKKQPDEGQEACVSEKNHHAFFEKYKTGKEKIKSAFDKKKKNGKKQPEKKNTAATSSKRTIKEKIKSLFKKKDIPKAAQSTQHKSK